MRESSHWRANFRSLQLLISLVIVEDWFNQEKTNTSECYISVLCLSVPHPEIVAANPKGKT